MGCSADAGVIGAFSGPPSITGGRPSLITAVSGRSGSWALMARRVPCVPDGRAHSAAVGGPPRVSNTGCGCPASQEVQRLFRPRARLGGVGEEGQSVVGGDVHAVEAEAEL